MEETKQEEKQTENEQRYEDEVEINDFPQTARWKVTSKVSEQYSYYFIILNKQDGSALSKRRQQFFFELSRNGVPELSDALLCILFGRGALSHATSICYVG